MDESSHSVLGPTDFKGGIIDTKAIVEKAAAMPKSALARNRFHRSLFSKGKRPNSVKKPLRAL